MLVILFTLVISSSSLPSFSFHPTGSLLPHPQSSPSVRQWTFVIIKYSFPSSFTLSSSVSLSRLFSPSFLLHSSSSRFPSSQSTSSPPSSCPFPPPPTSSTFHPHYISLSLCLSLLCALSFSSCCSFVSHFSRLSLTPSFVPLLPTSLPLAFPLPVSSISLLA